jgi:hypothetical protein
MLGFDPLSLVARFICRKVANSYFNIPVVDAGFVMVVMT